MRQLRLVLVPLAALLAAALALPATADPTVIVVGPGESIQAAIDRAAPGDTVKVLPGVYRENLEITTDALTLLGSGATKDGTVLLPPAEPAPVLCSFGDPEFVNGICVTGEFDEQFNLKDPVKGVRISGFLVKGFPAFGVWILGGEGTKVDHNVAKDNEEYGFFANTSTGTTFTSNRAYGSEEAGFYVGDSPDADARLVGNVARGNGFGFFLRDASNGVLRKNLSTGNCIGMLFLDTYADARNWRAVDNHVARNNRACPPSEEAPPLSGLGIAIVGTDRVTVAKNSVLDNKPSGETFLSGGVVVISSVPFGGSDPNGNVVKENVVLGNHPDLFWDGSGEGNVFADNVCETSVPPGLC